MLTRIRRHITFANGASALALIIALSGGVAYAQSQLTPRSVKSQHIAPRAVKAVHLAPNSVRSA